MAKQKRNIHPFSEHLDDCMPAFRCDYCKMAEAIERKLTHEEYVMVVRHMHKETVELPSGKQDHMDLKVHERFLTRLKTVIKATSGHTFWFTEHGPGLRAHH